MFRGCTATTRDSEKAKTQTVMETAWQKQGVGGFGSLIMRPKGPGSCEQRGVSPDGAWPGLLSQKAAPATARRKLRTSKTEASVRRTRLSPPERTVWNTGVATEAEVSGL